MGLRETRGRRAKRKRAAELGKGGRGGGGRRKEDKGELKEQDKKEELHVRPRRKMALMAIHRLGHPHRLADGSVPLARPSYGVVPILIRSCGVMAHVSPEFTLGLSDAESAADPPLAASASAALPSSRWRASRSSFTCQRGRPLIDVQSKQPSF